MATSPALLTATSGLLAGAAWLTAHRRSPAVRGWSPPDRRPIGQGPLAATAHGPIPHDLDAHAPVTVLLHGITASALSFGASWDRLGGLVILPDLLGFGHSMDVPAEGYTVDDHVSAVLDTLDSAGLAGRPLRLVGHSMGAVLALHLAAAVPRVTGVVALSAPLYDTEDEGLERIGGADPLADLLAVGDVAEHICHLMCRFRTTAWQIVPLLMPRWPAPVAREGVLHTWPSYRQSLQHLVLDSGWRDAVQVMADRDVGLRLVNGADDGVPVPGRAEEVAAMSPTWSSVTVGGADHGLPLSHGDDCVTLAVEAFDGWREGPAS